VAEPADVDHGSTAAKILDRMLGEWDHRFSLESLEALGRMLMQRHNVLEGLCCHHWQPLVALRERSRKWLDRRKTSASVGCSYGFHFEYRGVSARATRNVSGCIAFGSDNRSIGWQVT